MSSEAWADSRLRSAASKSGRLSLGKPIHSCRLLECDATAFSILVVTFLTRFPSRLLAMCFIFLLLLAYTCHQLRLNTVRYRWRGNCARCTKTSTTLATDTSDAHVPQRQVMGGGRRIKSYICRVFHTSNASTIYTMLPLLIVSLSQVVHGCDLL